VNYIVKHTTVYRGGHAQDPGYRSTVVIEGNREYAFLSHPDGNNVRRVETRRADDPAFALNFRRVADRHAFKKAPALEAAIKAYLAQYPHEVA
jgi:hypothetical protein